MYRMHRFCCRFPAVRGQAKRRPVRSHKNRGQARKTGFCPEGVGADLSAMGCVAALKQAILVVSGAPKRLVLLPVPGSSRTSEASPGPLPHKRSGPETGHLRCVWYTEAACFACMAQRNQIRTPVPLRLCISRPETLSLPGFAALRPAFSSRPSPCCPGGQPGCSRTANPDLR
ncbi:hypothetical protein SAMN05444064_103332 [Pseudomonas syringae]|nr:hypothetical protein SAMN05444514_103332 [Pseudomonas syringae]SFL70873.1 hypothetical protein SAMN05444064_103332 [Pseudomonas syringae]